MPHSAGSPPINGTPGAKVEAEDELLRRQLRDDSGQRSGPADRLQADDKRRDARREQGSQRGPIADSGIDPKIEAERADGPIERPARRPAGDGVEIGDVKLAEVEGVAKRAGDAKRLGIRVQPRPQRLIMVAVAADRTHRPSRFEVEDRDHPQRHEGLGSHAARDRQTTVLIHEWVTGGGLAGQSLPPSWAAEGHAMRRAIAGDFASLPGVRVMVTLDERFDEEPGPWSIAPVGPGDEVAVLQSLAAESDYTVLIAPETGGVLADRTRAIEGLSTRGLGSDAEAIELTGDKLRLGRYLACRGIATPPCRRVIPGQGLPADFRYPAVLKPIDGAGSQDTYLVRAADAFPEQARTMPVALLQPLVRGVAHSASFLVGRDGRAHLIAAGRQHIEIREDRFCYRGGTVPVPPRWRRRRPAPRGRVGLGPWRVRGCRLYLG